MTTLSSAAWVIHDVGLATTIGGTLFGRTALEPALDEISDRQERDQVSKDAWQRFSWVKLAAHAAFAVPWLIGRTMRSGREVSAQARALTRAKDVLVGVSLLTGVSSHVLGMKLGKMIDQGEGPESGQNDSRKLERTVGVLGTINGLVNVGILGLTALLAMEASKSVPFAISSRKLP